MKRAADCGLYPSMNISGQLYTPKHSVRDAPPEPVVPDSEREGPSLLDGIGGGSVPAMYNAFAHYADGLLDIIGGDSMPKGLVGPHMLPTGIVSGVNLPDDDFDLPSRVRTGPTLEMF